MYFVLTCQFASHEAILQAARTRNGGKADIASASCALPISLAKAGSAARKHRASAGHQWSWAQPDSYMEPSPGNALEQSWPPGRLPTPEWLQRMRPTHDQPGSDTRVPGMGNIKVPFTPFTSLKPAQQSEPWVGIPEPVHFLPVTLGKGCDLRSWHCHDGWQRRQRVWKAFGTPQP